LRQRARGEGGKSAKEDCGEVLGRCHCGENFLRPGNASRLNFDWLWARHIAELGAPTNHLALESHYSRQDRRISSWLTSTSYHILKHTSASAKWTFSHKITNESSLQIAHWELIHLRAMSAPSKDLAPYHPDHPEEFIPPFPSLPDEGSLDSPDPSEVLPKVRSILSKRTGVVETPDERFRPR
jgi:hypothetical protein